MRTIIEKSVFFNHDKLITQYASAVADPPVGDSATATPQKSYIFIFPSQKRKNTGYTASKTVFSL
jgi:hypothetical protein